MTSDPLDLPFNHYVKRAFANPFARQGVRTPRDLLALMQRYRFTALKGTGTYYFQVGVKDAFTINGAGEATWSAILNVLKEQCGVEWERYLDKPFPPSPPLPTQASTTVEFQRNDDEEVLYILQMTQVPRIGELVSLKISNVIGRVVDVGWALMYAPHETRDPLSGEMFHEIIEIAVVYLDVQSHPPQEP